MKNVAILVLFALLYAVGVVPAAHAQSCPDGKDGLPFTDQMVKKHMAGFEGCFVAIDASGKNVYRYNEKMCAERIAPLSTFKIFNSLAGLESGFVKDADFQLKWDGTKRELETHNHDHTLRTAVRDSVVWYFQKVAAGVGAEKMQSYLHAAGYGNEDMSGGLTKFWLSSSLLISPQEQASFVSRLYKEQLPFSKRSMDIVKEIIQVKQTDAGRLSGKTGTGEHCVLGWFVGYVEHAGKPTFFAICIRGKDALGRKARAISEAILHDAKLF